MRYIVWIDYGSEGWIPFGADTESPILDLNTAILIAANNSHGMRFVITKFVDYKVTESE